MANLGKELTGLLSFTQSKDKFLVSLNKLETLQKFDSIDLTFFLYPYNTNLTSSSFKFLPYEDYVYDLEKGRRSTYQEINDYGKNLFGLALALIILLIFALTNPRDIFSIQSIVSILGAYTIGKEFWIDFDNFLVQKTANWKLSWRSRSYFYRREDFGTIQKLWNLARIRRYATDIMLPSLLDFITHSNSKTVEMHFNRADFNNTEDNILIMTIDSEAKLNLSELMFGAKLSLNKRYLFINSTIELFQSSDSGLYGSVDLDGNWEKGELLVRHTFSLGRLKFYSSHFLLKIELVVTNR